MSILKKKREQVYVLTVSTGTRQVTVTLPEHLEIDNFMFLDQLPVTSRDDYNPGHHVYTFVCIDLDDMAQSRFALALFGLSIFKSIVRWSRRKFPPTQYTSQQLEISYWEYLHIRNMLVCDNHRSFVRT